MKSFAQRVTSYRFSRRCMIWLRLFRSGNGVSRASFRAWAISARLLGLMMIPSGNSFADPAISLRINTPAPSVRAATYSFAMRFIPSRSGVTRQMSLAA